MLDFKTLQAPLRHRDVLVTPQPDVLPLAVTQNQQSLAQANTIIAGQSLAHWRSQTRIKIAGTNELPIIVTGHQPDFIHPGVWAKHIVSSRLASALGGKVINLVVDSDVVKRSTLPIPTDRTGHVSLNSVSLPHARKGLSYEQMPKLSDEQIDAFESHLHETMGPQYQPSQWPAFFAGIRNNSTAKDWVDQTVAGRREIEAAYGISVIDIRMSTHWCTPLVADMLLNTHKFAVSYNRALHTYRQQNNIKGHARPIPNLLISHDRCEVALWAHASHIPRQRLFVATDNDHVRLFANETEIATLPISILRSHQCSACKQLATHLQQSGWELRPRALSLTLWARLLLADIFIHGIGGAKYDRITDNIIQDYYGIDPPKMACVSATLHLPFLSHTENTSSLSQTQREARDWQYNPQRALADLPAAQDQLTARQHLIARSQQLRSTAPKDRKARRQVFVDLRRVNQQLRLHRPDYQATIEAKKSHWYQTMQENEIAQGREYFFGLYPTQTLQTLLTALPATGDFAL